MPASTISPPVNALLDQLLPQMQAILGSRLVGVYLYGSLVTGDFDETVSDIDLLAAIATDLTDDEYAALDQVHESVASTFPLYRDRIEIQYYSRDGLKTFRSQASPIAVISPGEPFNRKTAGYEWLVNWYMVRTVGVTLLGPSPAAIIDSIAQDEFLDNIRAHMRNWRDWQDGIDTRPSQAYAILTMCRGLYTLQHGQQVSKLAAARWAQTTYPQWSGLIQNALDWRLAWRDPVADPAATLPETRRFIHFAIDQALAE